MITEWLMTIGSGLVTFITGLFPDWEPPEWLTGVDATVNDMGDSVGSLGAWADFNLLSIVATGTIGTYVVCFIIKLLLRAASHSPVSGGAG